MTTIVINVTEMELASIWIMKSNKIVDYAN